MAKRFQTRRYAQAVFEIARANNELDRWQSDLSRAVELVRDPEISMLLESPRIRFGDKVRLLEGRLPGASPLVIKLVQLLISRNRLGGLGDILGEYTGLLNSYRGIEQAEVVTAVALSDDEKDRIREIIKGIIGKEIMLKARVDPALIGGVLIRVKDKMIDGSTRNRLQALKNELAGVGS